VCARQDSVVVSDSLQQQSATLASRLAEIHTAKNPSIKVPTTNKGILTLFQRRCSHHPNQISTTGLVARIKSFTDSIPTELLELRRCATHTTHNTTHKIQKMKSQTFLYSMFALALESLTHSHAFLMQPVPNHPTQQHPQHHKEMIFEKTSQVVLYAGFGGGGGPKEKREVKLKPKQQWDRYLAADLKKEKPFRVAVKAEGKSSDEWLEVGNVKSKDSAYTKAAVARQRALIAEVRFVSIL